MSRAGRVAQIQKTTTGGLLNVLTIGLPARLIAAVSEEDYKEVSKILSTWSLVATEYKKRDWNYPKIVRYR